ncbi:alpha-L-fucosidase [Vibrio mimicus]
MMSQCHGLLAYAADNIDYVAETDPLVVRKLDEWQDLKFGFMMHWGPYSQWGTVESWAICSEDEEWIWSKRPNGVAYVDYVKQYEALPDTFNPTLFDPASWAKIAKEAGTKYVVFTTKHHDGFSMFDTRQTDYRITAPNVPFHDNPRANITRAVFDAFRDKDFGIGAYFSKPDWHSDDYWWPRFATPNRHPNYDTRRYPERWQRFVNFTHAQIGELTRDYGRVDILWLDGGWVRPGDTLDYVAKGKAGVPWAQDIDMPRLAAMARRNQPGLIVVDRAVGGRYENYRTPEQEIPDEPLPYPWETCMTLGDSWSYMPKDNYKSTHTVVQMLVDIVAKGGNYLLNVGPQPDGQLPAEAVSRLREIGAWLKVNGEAIYASRTVPPYRDGKFRYTRLKNGDVYAIYLPDTDEQRLPAQLEIPGPSPRVGSRLTVLGSDAELEWRREGDRTIAVIPEEARDATSGSPAWAIRLPSAAARMR